MKPFIKEFIFAGILVQASLAASANAEPDIPVVVLRGYALIHGQTVVLFPDKEALGQFDYSKCQNVGSSARVLLAVKKLDGMKIKLSAKNLGNPYAAFEGLGPHYTKLKGRIIQQWCDDRTIYWANNVRLDIGP